MKLASRRVSNMIGYRQFQGNDDIYLRCIIYGPRRAGHQVLLGFAKAGADAPVIIHIPKRLFRRFCQHDEVGRIRHTAASPPQSMSQL